MAKNRVGTFKREHGENLNVGAKVFIILWLPGDVLQILRGRVGYAIGGFRIGRSDNEET